MESEIIYPLQRFKYIYLYLKRNVENIERVFKNLEFPQSVNFSLNKT